jgi:hypothetical protein
VDTFQLSLLKGVLHELMHWANAKNLKQYNREGEEKTVWAHTDWLYEYIDENQSRLDSWRRLVLRHTKETK